MSDLHSGNHLPITISAKDVKGRAVTLENVVLADSNPLDVLALKADPSGAANAYWLTQGTAYDGTFGFTIPNVMLKADGRPGPGDPVDVAINLGDVNLFPGDAIDVSATVGTEAPGE